MNIKVKSLIIPAILLFLILAAKFSFETAGVILLVVFVLVSLKIFTKKAKKEYLAFNGIKSVPKKFVYNSNTLSNNHCIVRNFPNKKIVVMDNPISREHTTLRAFIVDKSNHENISNCWGEICSVYDEYTYLDTLFSFVDKASGRLSIIFLNQADGEFTVEGMDEFLPKIPKRFKEPVIKNVRLAKKLEQSAKHGQILVEFEDLQQQKISAEGIKENPKNVIDMQDLTDSDKIDINLANAQTISELPGINIVMAKKIVEYRNINGFFKNKDDFVNISGVKEHFKNKILSMITVEKSSAVIASKESEAEKERTVD